jgi:hypothetical protein
MANFTFGWAVPGEDHIIDCIDDGTGLTWVCKETEAQVKARYPLAVRVNLKDFFDAQRLASITQPVEITEERFRDMLEVLFPEHWHHSEVYECFQMVEHERDDITGTYVRISKRFFWFNDRAGMPPLDIYKKVQASDAYKKAPV